MHWYLWLRIPSRTPFPPYPKLHKTCLPEPGLPKTATAVPSKTRQTSAELTTIPLSTSRPRSDSSVQLQVFSQEKILFQEGNFANFDNNPRFNELPEKCCLESGLLKECSTLFSTFRLMRQTIITKNFPVNLYEWIQTLCPRQGDTRARSEGGKLFYNPGSCHGYTLSHANPHRIYTNVHIGKHRCALTVGVLNDSMTGFPLRLQDSSRVKWEPPATRSGQ